MIPGFPAAYRPIVSIVVTFAEKDKIQIDFTGPATATVAACGWTYSVNGGVGLAPTLATISDNKLTLTMAASLVGGDSYTVSYDPSGCDMAINGQPLGSIVDRPGVNDV